MRIALGALAAAISFALPSGLAQAAVVAGSVDDPKGDVPLIVAEEHPRDLKSFELVYDEDRGILKGRITHWDPQLYLPGYSGYHWFEFHADVGVARPDGSCDVTSTGSVRTDFATPDDGERPESIWAKASVVNYGSEIAGEISGTYDGPWTYTFASSAFIGRGYNCVTNIAATHLSSYTVDTAAGFCMGPAGTIACPISPAPISVKWIAPREGQTVSGSLHEGRTSCLAESTGPVARTENWVDGRLNDRQVSYPWGCGWDTTKFADGPHTLTVKAFAPDGRVSEHSVHVTVANGRSPAKPVIVPPVTDERTAAPKPIVLPQAGTLGETTRSLTAEQARKRARRAVRHRFGDRFAKRAKSGFKLACRRTSPRHATCSVKWSYGGWIYRSSVTLVRTAEGVDAVLRVKQRRRA